MFNSAVAEIIPPCTDTRICVCKDGLKPALRFNGNTEELGGQEYSVHVLSCHSQGFQCLFILLIILACVTKTNGWGEQGKACHFPFNLGDDVNYNECIFAEHGSFCATGVNAQNRMKPGKFGFCPPACPGGVFVGPSDVGGTCPEGTVTRTVTDTVNRAMDHCCCKIDGCCWAKCDSDLPPKECLPPGAKWKLNATLAGHYQAVLAGLGMKHLTQILYSISSYGTFHYR